MKDLSPECIVAFVHLGNNPSPMLLDAATQAKKGLPQAKLKIITNAPSDWEEFPGEIVEYESSDKPEIIGELESKHPVTASRAGGYWLRTLERLFILDLAYRGESPQIPLIHLESDVWSFIDSDVFQVMQTHCALVSVPAIKAGIGCASILYCPNLDILKESFHQLGQILKSRDDWIGDMELLGIGLNDGTLQELPTRPSESWLIPQGQSPSCQNVIFDAAALGQYLCGIDPVLTDNRVITGFEHPDFEIDLKPAKWSVLKVGSSLRKTLTLTTDDRTVRVANLHIHSKVSPGDICRSDSNWERLMNEAHGAIARQVGPVTPDLIHSRPPSLKSRLALARMEGPGTTLKRLVRRVPVYIHDHWWQPR